MSKSKRTIRFTVVMILVVLMAFLLPIQVFAETTPKKDPTETVTFDSLTESKEDANIVSEFTDRRDEYTKHFRMDDGTFMAVSYGCPVHYKNAKGKWVEYDNSLVAESEATSDEAVVETYTNKKSNININLATDTKANNLVNISSKKGNISWEYSGAKKSVVKITNSKNKKYKGNEKFTSIDKLTSKATYNNIYNNIDLESIINTTGVKENIILKNADAQNEFEIDYNIKGFKVKQINEQTINLTNGNGKNTYTISAPYMYDADGNTSTNLTLKILSQKGNKLKVKLTADKGFLDSWGRAYPVTIDPEVSLNSGSDVESAQVLDSQPNTVQGQQTHFYVGKSSSGTYSGLVQCKNVQENYSGKNIVSAKLNLFPMDIASEMEIEAYPITSSWTYKTATYNNIKYSSEIVDYTKVKGSSKDKVAFDLTKYVKKWANGSIANNGIYLKSNNNVTDFGGFVCYYPNKKPTFVVKYKDYTGSESNLTSHTVACGQDADASVCDYTGTIVLKQNICEENCARIPLNIYATYHSARSDVDNGAGVGWHMSFEQSVYRHDGYYIYTDGDGVEHYFKDIEGKTVFEDEDDLGYTITIKGNYIEVDTSYSIQVYDAPEEWDLCYILYEYDSENRNNRITYTYDDNNFLTKITSTIGEYDIYYDRNSYASHPKYQYIVRSIDTPSGKTINFEYNQRGNAELTPDINNLLAIYLADGSSSSFHYNSNRILTDIKQYGISSEGNSGEGKRYSFTYDDNNRLTLVKEFGKNDTSRKNLSVKCNDNNTTVFTDRNGNKETYTFDDYGNTITVLNANGSITNNSDSGSLDINTGSDSYTKNYIETSNEAGGIGNNYYYQKGNGTIGSQTSSGGQVTIETDHSYLGLSSIRVTHSGSSQIYTYAMHESNVGELAGKTVTLSSYVFTSGIKPGSLSGEAGAIIKLKCLDSSGATLLDKNSVPLVDTNSGNEEGWMRLSLTVDIPSNTSKYIIYFGIRNAQGSAWFDCMQLEKGEVMNDYNALSNSDFTSASDWTYRYKDTGETSFHTTSIPLNSDGDVHLAGKGCEPKSVQAQDSEEETEATVATETKIETETVDNDTVEETDANGNVTKSMQGFVTRKYRKTYEVTESSEDNNSSSNESGDSEDSVDSVNDCNNYIYQVIDVNQKYVTFNISGTAKAMSVPLNSDYRTFGIALKIKYSGYSDFTESHYQEFNAYTDIAQNVALSVTPEESDKEVEKVAFALVYGYNKNEMVIKNAMLNFAYNYQFGGNEENSSDSEESSSESEAINEEIISESVSTAKQYMQTSTAYDSTGNYVTSEVDEAGNTVAYTYDSDGNKTSVKDGNGNTTLYTYDIHGNVKGVTSGGASYTNSYSPTGQISKISKSGTSYSFEYDDFDNVTKVSVGTQTLVTNTYDSLCDKLKRTTYGNGGFLDYTYDSYGRITRITVAGNDLAKYKYNKKGLITECYDGWQLITTYYYYDCNGNLIAKYAEDDESKLAYYVWLDGKNTVETTNINGRYHNIVRGTDSNDDEYVKNDGVLITTSTDAFGRKEDVSTQFTSETDKPTYHTEYEYLGGKAANSTTNLVGNITYSYGSKSTTYDYLYDANNNITQVKTDGTVVAKYTYDSLNQLKTSADKNADTYTEYTYDTKGNITSTKVYNLTSGLGKGTTLKKTNTYTYGDNNWGDKLTSYNGQTITYYNIGNPKAY